MKGPKVHRAEIAGMVFSDGWFNWFEGRFWEVELIDKVY